LEAFIFGAVSCFRGYDLFSHITSSPVS
jgi:hypothetical protein